MKFSIGYGQLIEAKVETAQIFQKILSNFNETEIAHQVKSSYTHIKFERVCVRRLKNWAHRPIGLQNIPEEWTIG